MEYQKIANLLDSASNKPSKFRTKNWVEINDESRGGYTSDSDIKFKTTMLRSILCDYAIGLSIQQVVDADPRAIQQINFTADLNRAGNTTMFFIIEEPKETVLDLSQGIFKVLQV